MYPEKTLQTYAEELASASSAPAGGSTAAYNGALAAALLSMVAGVTRDNKRYAEYREEMEGLVQKTASYRQDFIRAMDEDCRAFDAVLQALKMPKNTEEERRARREARKAGYQKAIQQPLKLGLKTLELYDLADQLADHGSRMAAADVACAVFNLQAAMKGAFSNVESNLDYLSDEEYSREIHGLMDPALQQAEKRAGMVFQRLEERKKEAR